MPCKIIDQSEFSEACTCFLIGTQKWNTCRYSTNSGYRTLQIYVVRIPNLKTSKSARTARRSTPTSSKTSSAAPDIDVKSATSTRPTPSSPKSTQPASPMPIPESLQSSLTSLLQSPTTSKRLVFKTKNDSPHDGFNAKLLILEKPLIGYVHNLSPPRRNRGNTMNYCKFLLHTSAQETLEALPYSTHKRPLLLES